MATTVAVRFTARDCDHQHQQNQTVGRQLAREVCH
jgi:hypothetical protein